MHQKNGLERLGFAIQLRLMKVRAARRTGLPLSRVREIFDAVTNDDLAERSPSQLKQDLFALSYHSFKRNGYFVEFGAADGVQHSNTYLLESQFGWKGILAEPSRSFHADLAKSRSASLDERCVWKITGEQLTFNDTEAGVLSTLDQFSDDDGHAEARKKSVAKYPVETVSLEDLLDSHHAPPEIDYMSVDTEGSEFEILSAYDFSRRKISVVTIEHNRTRLRKPIHDLMIANGYRRVFEPLSRWDDWYLLVH